METNGKFGIKTTFLAQAEKAREVIAGKTKKAWLNYHFKLPRVNLSFVKAPLYCLNIIHAIYQSVQIPLT